VTKTGKMKSHNSFPYPCEHCLVASEHSVCLEYEALCLEASYAASSLVHQSPVNRRLHNGRQHSTHASYTHQENYITVLGP